MEQIKRSRVTLMALATVFLFAGLSGDVVRVQADAASTGTAIGTGIKDAITAAFPAISTIINAIWPSGAGKKSKTDATSATQTLQTQASQSLDKLSGITTDLDTITLFLSNCVVADDHVIAMRTMLQGKTALTQSDVLALGDEWNKANGALSNLKGASGQVTQMNDASVQVVLQAVVDSTSGTSASITQELSAGTPGIDLLSQNLQDLDQKLFAVNALSGQVIQNISSGLKAIKSAAAPGTGTQQPPAQQSQALQSAQQTFANETRARLHTQ